ncbi:amidase [Actinomadura roseirufa]|uniref:amidase n=1 Tax=Actinomadura roseirufa TaxID=2094049 RepID=UPI001F5E77BC|nr:amidase [Actinomadura roseirufa]
MTTPSKATVSPTPSRTAPASGRTAAADRARPPTITDLARDLREGRTTATELVRRTLDTIADLDPGLNAFVTVDAAGAEAAARRADRERAEGTDRGPLHGVPVAVKDLVPVAGLPSTMGSRHFSGHVARDDAACVRLLREAGAVVVGTTTTHEFAYGPTGDRSANGASRNPLDPERMSGGSSGGSATAVAAGMVPLAIGTDTGGSVRIPAALCGVAGFKPAYAAIPGDGVFPLSRTLDHVGLFAQTAEDCLTAYQALVPDGVSSSAGAPRVGWLTSLMSAACDPRVVRAVRGSLEAGIGPVADVRAPSWDDGSAWDEVRAAFSAVQSSEAAAVHADRLAHAPDLFDPEVLDRLRHAAAVPGWRYVRAMADRERFIARAGALFERCDVLALPTVPVTAPRLGERTVRIDGVPTPVRGALLSLTSSWNLLGLPALSVPAAPVGGLPTGLQLIARPGSEHLLFTTAFSLGKSEQE